MIKEASTVADGEVPRGLSDHLDDVTRSFQGNSALSAMSREAPDKAK
jgi:hypothetical protein